MFVSSFALGAARSSARALLPTVAMLAMFGILLASPVCRADLTDNLATSPTAMSLGNAVTADPPGIESIHFNPAGLARMTGNTRTDSLFVASIRTDESFNAAPDLDIGGFKDDPISGTSSGPTKQRLFLPVIGLLPARLPAVAVPGLGFTFNQPGSPFTFGTLSYIPMAFTIDRSTMPNDPAAFDGKVVDIQRLVYLSPAVGYKVSDTLRIGMSVPISYASIAINTDMRFPNPLLGTIGQLQKGTCPDGNGTIIDTLLFGLCGGGPQGMLNPFEKAANFGLQMTAPFDPTINLGVLWEPTNWFALGGVYQGGTSTVYHGTYQFETDPMIRDFVEGLNKSLFGPVLAGITGLPVQIPPLQSGNLVAKIPFPGRFQFGLKLKPVDALQFNVDVSYAEWSKWNALTLQFDRNIGLLEVAHLYGYANSTQLTLPMGFRSVVNYGFGTELHVTNKLALRAGYEPRKSSVPQSALSLIAPLPDTKLKSVGLQYKFDSGGTLNVAASYLKGSYHIPARSDCNLNCDGFFNLIYNPYAAENVSGDIVVRYFGLNYTRPF